MLQGCSNDDGDDKEKIKGIVHTRKKKKNVDGLRSGQMI